MLSNPKRAIWEALLLTVGVFLFGFFLGFLFESAKSDKMQEYYLNSELLLMDSLSLNSLVNEGIFDCSSLHSSYYSFADRIYNEAILLQEYESSEQITEEMKIVHRRYDLLRTFLWANTFKSEDECGDSLNIVVYLYEYNTEDLVKKATQNVWSKVLYDLKQQKGKDVLLIPIAVDLDIVSLNVLIGHFNITSYPTVVINNDKIVSELISSTELEKLLK